MISSTKNQFSLRLLQILFLSSVFILALNEIEDTDVWLHLSFGRLIWNLRGFPPTEPFLYTMQGQPFSYSSWLFGLIYYAAYYMFNIYGVIVLKAVTVTAALYILFRDSLRPHKNTVIAVLVMSFIVITLRYRFVERPDTFTMVFLAFSIFSLNAYIYENKKYLYALPFVHMLWANSHSSINLMFVPFLAFLAGGLLQHSLAGKSELFKEAPSFSQLKVIMLIFIASFAASLVSPYFINQYLFGAQFLASDWYKQEIVELRPPTWHTMKWPFIVAPAVLLSFSLNRKRISLMHIFLVLPFIALSFVASRFAFVLSIAAGPIIARNGAAYLAETGWWDRFISKTLTNAGTAAWLILFTALVLARVKPLVEDHVPPLQHFGFNINYDFFPEGALRFMDKRNITGRMFNVFEWGQYITWRDYPKRSAFIDGRGYLTSDLLDKESEVRYVPEVLDELYARYGFDSILLNYPVMGSASAINVDSALKRQGWALVYWDDISFLYLKRGGRYDSVILQDEYHYITRANGVSNDLSLLSDQEKLVKIIGELQRAIQESGSSRAYAFLGDVYNKIRRYQDAIEAFSHVRSVPGGQDPLPMCYDGIGYAYSALGRLDEAISAYKKAIELSSDPTIYINISAVYIKKNDTGNAIKYLEKAINMNGNISEAYLLLISLYDELNRTDDARRLEQRYTHALLVEQGREHIRRGIQANADRHDDVAAEEFKQAIERDPSNPEAYSSLGYTYFNSGMMNEAFEYQQRALEIDPNYVMASYGIALIYKNWGNTVMAKKYFEEYLRLEPYGYFSRNAKQYIKSVETMPRK
ncbi:MAG TPA: tetratricopeptide repeat protein [Nitrospirota bacterium]|nr:tetratricopeptide repeat protein [Nitrospirota bacterium]